MERGTTGLRQGSLYCPSCKRGNSQWLDQCEYCGTALRAPVKKPDLAKPEVVVIDAPNPWLFFGLGAVISPIFAFVPLLQYMGWFLASLVHELGHTLVAWFFGQPAFPAIRLDGHAAALHTEQKTLLVIVIGGLLAALLWHLRHRPKARVVVGAVLALHPLLAFTEAKEVIHLLGGHLSELVFAGIFFYRALSGGFTESNAERITYATMAWFLLGRNVIMNGGLMFSEAARRTYHGNGSFGLTNDFIRAARELGWSLEGVAALMMLFSLAVLPVAFLVWRKLDWGDAETGPRA